MTNIISWIISHYILAEIINTPHYLITDTFVSGFPYKGPVMLNMFQWHYLFVKSCHCLHFFVRNICLKEWKHLLKSYKASKLQLRKGGWLNTRHHNVPNRTGKIWHDFLVTHKSYMPKSMSKYKNHFYQHFRLIRNGYEMLNIIDILHHKQIVYILSCYGCNLTML